MAGKYERQIVAFPAFVIAGHISALTFETGSQFQADCAALDRATGQGAAQRYRLLTWHGASERQHQRLGTIRRLLAALLGVLLALNLRSRYLLISVAILQLPTSDLWPRKHVRRH
jgi:hypothetical protein